MATARTRRRTTRTARRPAHLGTVDPGDLRSPPPLIAGYDPRRDADDCRWDAAAARRAVEFFPAFLSHHKGFQGAFTLAPWQRAIVGTLFGWLRADGTRRYREALVAVPRKNGKTHLGAGLALYCLLCDGEPGPEVYSAAYSREQASLVYQAAVGMVRANPALAGYCQIVESGRRILRRAAEGRYAALPAESASAHGYNPSAVLFDELHTQRTRDLYDVLKTGTGARRQPLFVAITTAGFDRHSICWELWQYARQVRDGVLRDPAFLPVLYEAPEDADWRSVRTWRTANPNLGVSVSEEFLRAECERAKALPGYENTFRNLYLNQWTEQAERWLSLEAWERGNQPLPDLSAKPSWAGLDLSATTDLTALCLAWKRGEHGYYVRPHFWIPGESLRRRVQRDRVPYDVWARQGLITLQEGRATIDHDLLIRDVAEILRANRCRQIAVDRWNADHVANELSREGFDVIKFGQGFSSMSGPTKLFEQLVIDGDLIHGGNPLLAWNAANVAVSRDAAENKKPDKAKSTERIDGIVAAIMAVGLASVHQEVRGALVIV